VDRKHPASVEIPTTGFWQPFLQHIQTLHPSFASVLTRVLIDEITLHEDKSATNNRPQGRFFCLAGWLLWVPTVWAQLPECDPTAIVEQLLLRMWQPRWGSVPQRMLGLANQLCRDGINELLDKLTEGKPSLRARVDAILAISSNNSNVGLFLFS
jgi:hypothetical protein